jgi:hypothetical protein
LRAVGEGLSLLIGEGFGRAQRLEEGTIPTQAADCLERPGGLGEVYFEVSSLPAARRRKRHETKAGCLPVAAGQGLEVLLAEAQVVPRRHPAYRRRKKRLVPEVGGRVEPEAVIPLADVGLHCLMIAESAWGWGFLPYHAGLKEQEGGKNQGACAPGRGSNL